MINEVKNGDPPLSGEESDDNIGCDYCRDGDRWPVNEEVWHCPKCDAEWYETDV